MGSLFHCWPHRGLFLDVVLLIQIWAVFFSFQGMGAEIVHSISTSKPRLMLNKEIEEGKRRIGNNFDPLKPLAEFFDRLETINRKGEEVKKKTGFRLQLRGPGEGLLKLREGNQAKTFTHQKHRTERPPRNENHDILGANDESRRKHIPALTGKTEAPPSDKEIRFLKSNEEKRFNDEKALEDTSSQKKETADEQPSNEKIQRNGVSGNFTTNETSTLKILKIDDANNKKEMPEPKPHSLGDITFLRGLTRNRDFNEDKSARIVDVVTERDRNHERVEHSNPEKNEADTRKTQGVENNVNQGALEKGDDEEASDVDKQEEEHIKNKVKSSTTKKVATANDDEGITDKVVDKTLKNAGKKPRKNRLTRREANRQQEKGDHEERSHKKNEQVKVKDSKKNKGEEDKKEEPKVYPEKDSKNNEDLAGDKDLEVAGLGYIMFKEKEKDKEKGGSDHDLKKDNGGKKTKRLDASKLVDGHKCEEEKKQNGHKKGAGRKHHNGDKGKHHEHKKEKLETHGKDTSEEFRGNPKTLTGHVSEEVYEVRGVETERRALHTHGYNNSMSTAAIHILVVLGICLFGFVLLIFVFAKTRSNTGRMTRVNSQTALYEPRTKYDKYEKFEY